MSTKKILFPTDLTPSSEPAERLALALAGQQGAEVLLLHVVLTHADDLRQFGALLSDLVKKLEAEAEQKLDQKTSRLREQGFVVRYEVVQAASAFEAIQECATSWKPDLIVMATHGRTGMPRWFLGSVSEKIVHHAPCSVATVRPGEGAEKPTAIERILVPVDFSDNSRRALAHARELADGHGSLILHHVVHNPTLAGLSSAEHLRLFSEEPTLPDKIRGQMEAWMEGQSFEAEVTEGDDIAASIIEIAEKREADLIVIGARGQTGFEHFLTGSVAEKLVRSSPVPVVTVR